MNEGSVRRIHQMLGITVAWFLLVQVFAGLLLSLGMLASASGSKWYQILATIHAGENPLESVYRVALGLATLVQVTLGIAIFFLSRKRQERGKRA